MKPTIYSLGRVVRAKTACIFVLCAIALPAQTFTTLLSFDSTNGALPDAALIQAADGNYYGTTGNGGNHSVSCTSYGCGTVFKITPTGALTTLYSFCSGGDCSDGYYPEAGLVQAANGDFYGTTKEGGTGGDGGSVFKITPGGVLTALYGFCSSPPGTCADGLYPIASLVQADSGDFYGTTAGGGSHGVGTIFRISPSGTITTLYSFAPGSSGGGSDPSGPLIQATDGNFYGTAESGGAYQQGTVFKITPRGELTTLYSFCPESGCTDGREPIGGLIQSTNGDFYGATDLGGADNKGTVFKITSSGVLTTLYSFCSQSGCETHPVAGLIQATDGNFYATTAGSIIKLTPRGELTTLYSFCSQSGCTDGSQPQAGLMQATDGKLYGTTVEGGTSSACDVSEVRGCGTVFSLSVGLGPFVKTPRNFGRVGAVVEILGTNLTGATSVTFNGTPSPFRVSSSSLIVTTVPTGATTGTIQVVTPSGTLSSYPPFRVVP